MLWKPSRRKPESEPLIEPKPSDAQLNALLRAGYRSWPSAALAVSLGASNGARIWRFNVRPWEAAPILGISFETFSRVFL